MVDFGTTAKSKVNFYLGFLDVRQQLYIAIVISMTALSAICTFVYIYLYLFLRFWIYSAALLRSNAAVFNYTYSWQRL